MRVLIVAGGTGGHVYPALAVARSLRALPDAPELAWVGGRRGIESRLVPEEGIPFRRLLLRSLRTVDADLHAVLDPLRLVASLPQALFLLARRRPDAIFTTGGFVAVPVLVAAAILRVPAVLWEGNAVPGRSVRATARLVRAKAVSYAQAGRTLGGDWYLTGTPIRDLAGDRAASRAGLGVAADARCLLVFGGSQEVRRFNDAVREALPELAARATLLHVTGPAAIDEFRAARDALPEADRANYRPVPFLDGADMTAALLSADLVVGRAGSSTLAEVSAAGRPMVVVPYPHAAGHQAANARAAVDAGAAILVADDVFDGAALLRAADLLEDPDRLSAMAEAARALAHPGAARAVAALVDAVARRGTLPAAETVERLAGEASNGESLEGVGLT
jgi:UDP-N-acetylglucosamine--N-acetylmuramyl-(pentapeptide) pyrophosphoryl-undecaprenol N-acetylglucosamine transferase